MTSFIVALRLPLSLPFAPLETLSYINTTEPL